MADVVEIHGGNDFEDDTEGDRKYIQCIFVGIILRLRFIPDVRFSLLHRYFSCVHAFCVIVVVNLRGKGCHWWCMADLLCSIHPELFLSHHIKILLP